MPKKLIEIIPVRVSREVIECVYVNTLEDGNTIDKQHCRICDQFLPKDCFFVKAKRDRKNADDRRSVCIPCWKLFNGKDPKNTLTPPTNDLSEFIDNGENDERTILVGGEVSTQDSRRMYST